ncbi:MAG TPA: hypothetical protein EYN15_01740, partial [Chromatiales bacterium]|nr:hypothetical protein [Chromatiales bacterium]
MKNNSFFGAILLATITLDSSVAFADNALPPILISKARTESVSLPVATNIEVISRTQIQSSGASTVTDLIRGHAGIQIEDSFGDGSTATIDMRGFGATAISNVLVMVDGRRLNNSGDTGTLDLNTIDIDNIERIEIVEGSAGVLFGNQAVGGVINIITRDPTTTEVTVRIDHGRHGGLSGIQLHAADQYDSGINYRVTVKQQGSHNYRDNNNHQLHHGALRIGMKHSDGEV